MSFFTLSFSGAGHLLPYHLGVATVLLRQSQTNNSRFPMMIRAVAGSSAGAIAATVMAMLPQRVEEYSDRFLQDRGHAFRNLQQMLMEIEADKRDHHSSSVPEMLAICTTKCSNGKMHLFSYDTTDSSTTAAARSTNIDAILKSVQASCVIPRSFHPFDMFSRQPLSYPDDEGIEMEDGTFHVDGGIAAPVPPTPLDHDSLCLGRIEVSPISGPLSPSTVSIRPNDTSLSLLPFPLTTTRCQPFSIRPSVQNVRAMVVSMGFASPEVLRDWYRRGMDDANEFVVQQKQQEGKV